MDESKTLGWPSVSCQHKRRCFLPICQSVFAVGLLFFSLFALFFFFYLCVCALGVDFIAAIFTLETFVVCAFYLDVCACMCVR